MRIGVLPWVVLLFCVGCGGDRPVGPVLSPVSPAAKPTQALNHHDQALPKEDWFGYWAFGTAIEEGNLPQVRFWVEAGMEINQLLDGSYNGPSFNGWGHAPLAIAAQHNRAAVARYLLDQGADVNGSNGPWITALMMATLKGSLDVVKVLVDAGADVSLSSVYGDTALLGACCCWAGPDQLAIIQYLVEEGGARVNQVSHPKPPSMSRQLGRIPLKLAARSEGPESLAILAYLVEKGAMINSRNEVGQTALMDAANEGSEDKVRLLVSLARQRALA